MIAGVYVELTYERLSTDLLIIGGGTAGCYAAITFREHSDKRVLIMEKADIRRSGCLAAGVNALNAYITRGRTAEDYVKYAVNDAAGIARHDLLLTMAQGLNAAASRLESLGLTILKDSDGQYAERGPRNIKINGENIKPILANAVINDEGITVMNRVNAFAYITVEGEVIGAIAIDINRPVMYIIAAKAVICATGGAAGLYRPNHPGFSQHKMWYCPFNTGTGYAMGISAGAEMTTMEMRFIALRCKDTIAPTGTLAQGANARQVNAHGASYERQYGLTTSQRVHGTVEECRAGRGPCYLQTADEQVNIHTDNHRSSITDRDAQLYKAYLNMCPSQTLRWIETAPPSQLNVEIEGTEPYIVGGHTASGYWVDTSRETTLRRLFAAGDCAGGCPQKYVTGACVEGAIAAASALRYMDEPIPIIYNEQIVQHKDMLDQYLNKNTNRNNDEAINMLEEEMQSIMDEYAGGITQDYRYSDSSLRTASSLIHALTLRCESLSAHDMRGLISILELRERLTVCAAVIEHLRERRETRWHCFAEHTDYPDISDEYSCYINTRYHDGQWRIIRRELITEAGHYEHCD